MKISIITVCFNSVATIEKAIDSVSSQDWSNKEHIVIDGGSTDGTLEILQKLKPNLACLVSEKDNGIYDAMNKGIYHATGDIICFLNSDDYYVANDVLSKIANIMQNNRLDALFGDVGFFHKNKPNKIIRRYNSGRFSPDKLAWGWIPAHPSLFLHKKVVQRVGNFDTNYLIAGDYEFMIRVFHNQSLRYQHLDKILVHMQIGGASTSGLLSKIQLNKEVLRACRKNGLKTNIFKILSKYPLKLLEYFYPS